VENIKDRKGSQSRKRTRQRRRRRGREEMMQRWLVTGI
jgi:hypothetical protein